MNSHPYSRPMPVVAWAAALACLMCIAPLARAGAPTPQTGGFTYQGVLKQNGAPYNGTADFEFRLFDGSDARATQIGPTLAANSQTLVDGASNTILDFQESPPAPPVWDGSERWLEIRVRTPAGSANPFVTLGPRQRIANAPYASYALSAPNTSPFAFNGANGIFSGAGNVGIGAANPSARLSVSGGGLNVFDDGNDGIHLATDSYSFTTASNEDPIYQYSFASDTHFFSTGGTSRLTINAAGNVGIGTTAPSATLDVAGSLEVDNTTLVVSPTNDRVGIGTSAPPSLLSVYEANESATQTNFTQGLATAGINVITDFTANAYTPGIFWSTQNDNPTRPKAGIHLRETATGTEMRFGTSNNYATGITNSAMIIDPSGKVGLAALGVAGGSDTVPVLEVNGASGADIIMQAGSSSANAGSVLIAGGSDTGSAAEDAGGVVITGGGGHFSSGIAGGAGGNVAIRGGIGGSGTFGQGPTGHVHLQPENLVTPAGRVGIGMPFNGSGNAPPEFTLHVDGSAGKPGGGSWTATSDIRLKKNIAPLRNSLDRLLRLRGVTFEYADPAKPLYISGVQTGMIAQEVERVFPEWINETDDGWKTLTFRGFEALTVEALRELNDRLASAEAENMLMRQQNEHLMQRVEALEHALERLLEKETHQ